MLLFGSSRVSEMGKGLGEGIRNFKKGLREEDEEPPPRKKARVVDASTDGGAEDEEAPPPKQLAAGTVTKKKRVIQIEVDDDADEEEIARQIAEEASDDGREGEADMMGAPLAAAASSAPKLPRSSWGRGSQSALDRAPHP